MAIPLRDVAKLTQVVVDRSTVQPGDLVVSRVALPMPGDSPVLGDSAFAVDVSWRIVNTQPQTDADGFIWAPPSALAQPTGQAANAVALVAGEGLKLPAVPPSILLIWWNTTDYTDPQNDPAFEVVQVTAKVVDALTVNRPQLGTARADHNAAGKTYSMRLAPPTLHTVHLSAGYDAAAMNVVLQAGHAARLSRAVPFFLNWWDSVYDGPQLDPTSEIVVVTAIDVATETLTIRRAQRGTAAANHNTVNRTYKMRPLPPEEGLDFITPRGLDSLTAAFGLMPPFAVAVPPPRRYWIIADLTLRRAAAPAALPGDPLALSLSKVSLPIDAVGLGASELKAQLAALLKIEVPATPVAPGSSVTARLRPKGGEDAEWDVESASEVVPQFQLAANVKLDALFKPLDTIINGVFGILNEILVGGVRLLGPLVRMLGGVAGGLQAAAGEIGSWFGVKKDPVASFSVDRFLDELLRRLRIPRGAFFKNLLMPIDADMLNRDFTKNLVPRDSAPPLPGPRNLLPTIPTLEKQLELKDELPSPVSVLPVTGGLHIPLSLTNVIWELWRPDATVSRGYDNVVGSVTLVPGEAAQLSSTVPFWLVWWNDTDSPGDPANAGDRELVEVIAIGRALDDVGVPNRDTLTLNRPNPVAHNAAGKTYRMRLAPAGQLVRGPAVTPASLSSPLAEVTMSAGYAAGATQVTLAAGEASRLPQPAPFWSVWWNSTDFPAPQADPAAEIIEVLDVNRANNQLRIRRGQYHTPDTNHNLPNKTYKVRVLADYFEVGHTASRLLSKTLVLEPPVEPEMKIELRVRVAYVLDPSVAAIADTVALPPVPLRLTGLDPLAFVASQLQLISPLSRVDLGEVLPVQLASGLPLEPTAANNVRASFTIGELPARSLPIAITWEVLDQNLNALAPGTDYVLGAATATAISVLLAPAVQIVRREAASSVVRNVRVRLQTNNPPLQLTLPALSISVQAIQLPLFVAIFKYGFFAEKNGDEAVQVFLPAYYAAHAPSWVESWEVFRDRLDDLQRRLGALLGLLAAYPASPQEFSSRLVQRVTLWRAALDYIANRPASGALSFLSGRLWHDAQWAGEYLSNHPSNPAGGSFFAPKTLIVVNDARTSLQFAGLDENGDWFEEDLHVSGTPTKPVCILKLAYFWDGYYTFTGMPNTAHSPWEESVNKTFVLYFDYANLVHLHLIHARYDQDPGVTHFFQSPAALWR